MMTADKLFFKGHLLPFKDAGGGSVAGQKTTLRDERLAMMTPPMFRSGRTRLWVLDGKGFQGSENHTLDRKG
ncbi:hypothetical protein R6Q57_009571 [Mikania cordata]